MIIRELRNITGLSQSEFAKKFHIPVGTLAHWEQEIRKPPEYVVYMISRIVYNERKEYNKQSTL
jgi:putative transcriptional regulator